MKFVKRQQPALFWFATLTAMSLPVVYLIRWGAGLSIDAVHPPMLTFLGIIVCVFGCAVFYREGGRLITPSGVYFLSTAVFVGLAALMVAWRHPISVDARLVDVMAAVHAVNLATWLLLQRFADPAGPASVPESHVNGLWPAPVRHTLLVLSVAGLVCALALELAVPAMQAVVRPLAVLAIVGLSVCWAANPRRFQMVGPTVILGAALLIYVAVLFSGFGRLGLAALALGCFMATNMVRPKRWHKIALLAAVFPGLLVGGLVRAEQGGLMEVASRGEGLASVYIPLTIFRNLSVADTDPNAESFPRQWGATALAPAVVLVPRDLWEGKPAGLGTEVAYFFVPQYAVSGHTLPPTAYGEWYVNFGWFGLVPMAVVGAAVLVYLDRLFRRSLTRPDRSTAGALRTVAILVAASGLVNYVWGSSFTFAERSGISIVLALALAWLIGRPGSETWRGRHQGLSASPRQPRQAGRLS